MASFYHVKNKMFGLGLGHLSCTQPGIEKMFLRGCLAPGRRFAIQKDYGQQLFSTSLRYCVFGIDAIYGGVSTHRSTRSFSCHLLVRIIFFAFLRPKVCVRVKIPFFHIFVCLYSVHYREDSPIRIGRVRVEIDVPNLRGRTL